MFFKLSLWTFFSSNQANYSVSQKKVPLKIQLQLDQNRHWFLRFLRKIETKHDNQEEDAGGWPPHKCDDPTADCHLLSQFFSTTFFNQCGFLSKYRLIIKETYSWDTLNPSGQLLGIWFWNVHLGHKLGPGKAPTSFWGQWCSTWDQNYLQAMYFRLWSPWSWFPIWITTVVSLRSKAWGETMRVWSSRCPSLRIENFPSILQWISLHHLAGPAWHGGVDASVVFLTLGIRVLVVAAVARRRLFATIVVEVEERVLAVILPAHQVAFALGVAVAITFWEG